MEAAQIEAQNAFAQNYSQIAQGERLKEKGILNEAYLKEIRDKEAMARKLRE